MNREDMIKWASPPCHDCGEPVQRLETRWHMDEDGNWRISPSFMVCGDGHRVLVEGFDD